MSNDPFTIGQELNTHGVVIDFGKHKGTLLTRVPKSYIRWMANEEGLDPRWKALAKAEYERRGMSFPVVELSGHAIDNASLRVRRIWHDTALPEEGLYSWLMRMTLEALKHGECIEHEVYIWQGMKLVIQQGEEFPSLKTIMPSKRRQIVIEAGRPRIVESEFEAVAEPAIQ